MFLHKTNRIHQFLCFVWIHTGCRLIKKKELRICSQCSGDLKFTLLTIWKVSCKCLSFLVKIKYFQNLHCFFIHFLLDFMILRKSQDSSQCGIGMMIVQSYFNVVKNRHFFKQTNILESSRNTCFVDLYCALSCDILSIEFDNTFCWFVNTCKKVENCCFSCTVRSDQAIQLALFDRYIKSVNCAKTAELNSQMIYL